MQVFIIIMKTDRMQCVQYSDTLSYTVHVNQDTIGDKLYLIKIYIYIYYTHTSIYSLISSPSKSILTFENH